MGELIDLDIMAADVGNAYLNANPRERSHLILGKDIFGPEHEGKTAVTVRALYGLRTSGAAWRHHFAEALSDMGFKSSYADPDVWLRPEVTLSGKKTYSYIMVYVDDLLIISQTPNI